MGFGYYIFALFDVKLNTLVSVKLVESEDYKTILSILKRITKKSKENINRNMT